MYKTLCIVIPTRRRPQGWAWALDGVVAASGADKEAVGGQRSGKFKLRAGVPLRRPLCGVIEGLR